MPRLPENYREQMMQRQEQQAADREKTGQGKPQVMDFSKSPIPVKEWKPRYMPDENAFDIVPFIVSQPWFEKLRSPAGRPINIPVGMPWYKLEIPVHSKVGNENTPMVCLREAFGRECCQCDDMFALYKVGKKDDGKKLKPKWRTFYNIFDYDDTDKGFQLFEISYYLFENTTSMDPQRTNLLEAMKLAQGGVVPFWDHEIGSTILAKFKKKMMDKTAYPEVDSIIFEPRDPYDPEELFGKVYPLDAMLIIPTEEQFRNAYYGLDHGDGDGEASQNDTAQETTTASAGGRSRTRQTSTQAPPADESPVEEEPQDNPDGEEDVCPAGATFGLDCNTVPECDGNSENSCDAATFERCLMEHERRSSMANDTPPPRQSGANKDNGAEEKKEPTARSRTTTAAETKEPPPARSGRTRQTNPGQTGASTPSGSTTTRQRTRGR